MKAKVNKSKGSLVESLENSEKQFLEMVEESEEEKKEKRHYRGKINSDIVNVPLLFRQTALSPTHSPDVLDAPITSYRIFFKILNDVSNDQFNRDKQPEQLALFQDDFMTSSNTFCRFTFKVTEIDKNKDYKSIMKGLSFLENLHKGWYKSVNSKGKTVKTQFGVISTPAITDGEISFLMSSHWLKQILEIPSYNTALFKTAWEFKKGKQFLFYLWLLEVPLTGTKVNFLKFQDIYGYEYKTVKDFTKYVLKSIKNKLDKISNVSFNYSVKGDIINIVPYSTKEIALPLKVETVSKQQITQKLHYWKIRHELSSEQIKVIRDTMKYDKSIFSLLKKSYDIFVEQCMKDKINVKTYLGKSFLEEFQSIIIKCYKDSAWNGIKGLRDAYPRIK